MVLGFFLQNLNFDSEDINLKNASTAVLQDEIDDNKKTISSIRLSSQLVQKKYDEVLMQLKSELAKTESECKYLQSRILDVTAQRMNSEANEVIDILEIYDNIV